MSEETEGQGKSYVNDTGQAGIKLDIPETGVSLTELDNFLREKLGHDTHITGEVVRMATGVSLTARTDGFAGRKDKTRTQYQKALTLDLTVADRAELPRQMRS